jgi:hypothetical protein
MILLQSKTGSLFVCSKYRMQYHRIIYLGALQNCRAELDWAAGWYLSAAHTSTSVLSNSFIELNQKIPRDIKCHSRAWKGKSRDPAWSRTVSSNKTYGQSENRMAMSQYGEAFPKVSDMTKGNIIWCELGRSQDPSRTNHVLVCLRLWARV